MPVNSVNILLVDDEPRNLEVLEEVLRQPDYCFVRANNAQEALVALLQQEFALIVTDVQMPEISGIELAQLIKQRAKTQHIPIIFLTAFYQDERRMLESYGVGAVDYLTKPVNSQVLRTKAAVFVDLHRKNAALAQEIVQREKAETALRVANEVLEERVAARTAELSTNATRAQLLAELSTDFLKIEVPQALFENLFARVALNLRVPAYCVHLLSPDNTRFTQAAASLSLKTSANVPTEIQAEPASFDHVQTAIRAGLGSRLASSFPVAAGGRLLGVFTVVLAGSASLGESELRFIRTACDFVAAGLERARLTGELRGARDKAEQAGHAKDEFLAALSHELRTPLNPVLLIASDAAENPGFPAEARAQFATIRKNAELEARLIDDLLDLTRITHGKMPLEIKPGDAHSILEDALANVRAELTQKQIDLRLDLSASRTLIEVDAVRLQQVFWNLLRNAVKFTPENGTVTVRTRAEGSTLTISVADTGIGLSPVEISRIFDAFAQGDHAEGRASHRFGGLGLGLTISRSIVEKHGGTLAAQSEGHGYGATFVVTLPLPAVPVAKSPVNAHGDLSPASPATKTGPHLATIAFKTILLVEDHEPTRKTLETLLRRRHFVVTSSGSLAGARGLAAAQRFDVLISDIGLPDGTGFDLMNEMKGLGVRGIALTGYGMEEDVGRSHLAGFSVHLTKPIQVRSLDLALAKLSE